MIATAALPTIDQGKNCRHALHLCLHTSVAYSLAHGHPEYHRWHSDATDNIEGLGSAWQMIDVVFLRKHCADTFSAA